MPTIPFPTILLFIFLQTCFCINDCPGNKLCKSCAQISIGKFECISCQNSYRDIKTHTCSQVPKYLTNCITYDPVYHSKCTQCYYGYFVNDSGICVSCPENCWKCENDNTCLACSQERAPVNGDCKSLKGEKCNQDKIKNCEFCSSKTECLKCRYGFSLNEEHQCIASMPNCLEVKDSHCKECWNLYYLNNEMKCVVINKNSTAWYIFMTLAFMSLAIFAHGFFKKENVSKIRMTEDSNVSILANLR